MSVSFVRHPLERLVSAYADKMLFTNWNDTEREDDDLMQFFPPNHETENVYRWGQEYNRIKPWRDRILREQR